MALQGNPNYKLYEELFQELALNFSNDIVLVKDLIPLVAEYYGIEPEDIRRELRLNKSKFYSSVVGFDDGKPISRSSLDLEYKRIMKNVFKKIDVKDREEKLYILDLMSTKYDLTKLNFKEVLDGSKE